MTNDAEKALIIIYCQYKKRLSLGTNEEDAIYFENAKLQNIDSFSDWGSGKLNLSLQELKKLGYIFMNIWDDVTLLPSGIAFMQSKTKQYFSSFVGIIKNLSDILALFL